MRQKEYEKLIREIKELEDQFEKTYGPLDKRISEQEYDDL